MLGHLAVGVRRKPHPSLLPCVPPRIRHLVHAVASSGHRETEGDDEYNTSNEGRWVM